MIGEKINELEEKKIYGDENINVWKVNNNIGKQILIFLERIY